MTKNDSPLEYWEQVQLVNHLEDLKEKGDVILFTALPQNLYTKSWKQKSKQKMEGVRQGFPDLCIVLKNKVIFIELKREKGGIVSKYQKEWIEAINEAGGVAVVCKGHKEARKFIKEQLGKE